MNEVKACNNNTYQISGWLKIVERPEQSCHSIGATSSRRIKLKFIQ
jgi:hypothetical protein